MKKLFNNSTKDNDTQNQSSKSKRKFLKTFSFTSLAFLMGIAGTMAFAPLGTNPSVAIANEIETTTTGTGGLIIPSKDDPIIYTTESGLNIYAGKVVLNSNFFATMPFGSGGGNPNGNLKTFPYFETKSGTTSYYWTIIGQSTTNPPFVANEPASQAIQSEVFKQYINNSKEEIPEGCVLVLANDNVTTGVYNTVQSYYSTYKDSGYGGSENIKTTMEGYYTNGDWGLSSIKNNIQAVTLRTLVHSYRGSWAWRTDVAENQHIYPLGANTSATFYYKNYLTAAQISLTTIQWIRGDAANNSGTGNTYYLNTSGAEVVTGVGTNGIGYRPAFCLKIT